MARVAMIEVSRCNTDREFCEKVDKLLSLFLTGDAVLRSCRGRALYGFRPVAGARYYVTVTADGDQRVALDIVLSTGGFAHVVLDRGELCVHSADVAFSYVPGVVVSHKVIARN
jgi:hypothetical protein